MSSSSPIAVKPLQDSTDESVRPKEKPGYAALSVEHKLAFDPTKDLNLPSSYEEVNARFRRLQAARAMEDLN